MRRLAVALLAFLLPVAALAQGYQQQLPIPVPAALGGTGATAFAGLNLLQNGDMLVDQPNEAAAVTVTSGGGQIRSVDRWKAVFAASTSGAGNPTVQQQAASSGAPSQFRKSILVTVSGTPGTTVPAALRLDVQQQIEGADLADLGFGASSPQSITVSFWAKSSIANATIGIGLGNNGNTRTYVTTVNIPSAATWTQLSATIAGDTSGTWATGPGQIGMQVTVGLAAGSTFQTTAGAWGAPGFAFTTSAQTQFTNTASSTFEITGVKLERGSTATPYWSVPYAQNILTLKRYYWKTFAPGTAPAQNVASVVGAITVKNPVALGDPSIWVPFNPPMYAAPTVTTYNPSAGNANWRDVTAGADATVSVDAASSLGTTGVNIATSGTVATLGDYLAIHATFDSGL